MKRRTEIQMHDIFKIFGSSVRVSIDGSPTGALLRRELGLYPAGSPDEICDLEIVQGEVPRPDRALMNPAIHSELQDGFIAQFGPATVQWQFDEQWDLRRVRFELTGTRASARWQRLRRIRSMQFTAAGEDAGQVFHELVLVPSAYFMRDRFLLHASALQAPNGDVTLIGGTGGVGKTSLELEFCRGRGYAFVADDVVAVDHTGHVWPNLAFPKIYGYNLEGDDDLSRSVLAGRGLEDRVHWHLHARRGLHRVRRRVSPADLYGRYSESGGPLRKYVFISREIREDFHVEAVNAETMIALSMPVMRSEYEVFHRHLEWHEMNRVLMREDPVFTTDSIFARWERTAIQAFQGVDCLVIHAPKYMAHMEFRERMSALVAGAQ